MGKPEMPCAGAARGDTAVMAKTAYFEPVTRVNGQLCTVLVIGDATIQVSCAALQRVAINMGKCMVGDGFVGALNEIVEPEPAPVAVTPALDVPASVTTPAAVPATIPPPAPPASIPA